MQICTVSLKLLQTCRSWQKEVKKEYYFGPVLCKVWSREFMNTRETLAILCWLRRGDMLGSRRNAKRLWASYLFCLFHTISKVRVTLLPLTIYIPVLFPWLPFPATSSPFRPCALLFRILFSTLVPYLSAWWSKPPPNILMCPLSLIWL